MAGTSSIETTCKKCGTTFEATVVDHLTLALDEDIELAKTLKTGRFNRVQCPKCKKVDYLERSIVINFEPQNLIVFYDKNASNETVRQEIMSNYDDVTRFNEILEETRNEIEFQVISSAEKLKELIDEYLKQRI